MRISIQQQNKLLHIVVEDEECFMYSLEIIEDLDTKQIFIKSGGELINSLYEEDLDKLTISDFMYNNCLYTLYKKFINVLNQLKIIPKDIDYEV